MKRTRKEKSEKQTVEPSLAELIATIARLRGKEGCPWDMQQTHASLKPCLLEETYELLEAIDRGDPKELAEELGDLLLQVVFHCQIAKEEGRFTIQEVLSRLNDKLVGRHPHVFSGQPLPDAEAVLKQRARIKAREKRSGATGAPSIQVPKAMPALARAQRVTERAAEFGFDWPAPEEAWKKVEEELGELKKALRSDRTGRAKEEMGDLLFSLVNICRFLDIEAEEALSQTAHRFLSRFAHIETRLREQGKTLADSSLKEMDSLWDEAKKLERSLQP